MELSIHNLCILHTQSAHIPMPDFLPDFLADFLTELLCQLDMIDTRLCREATLITGVHKAEYTIWRARERERGEQRSD